MGWRIHRIWSTDWFRNPDGELKRLVGSIEEAKLYGGVPQENGHGATSRPTDIARGEGLDSAETPTVPKYGRWESPITFSGEFHRVSPNSLGDIITKIVEVESPIHVQELSRRVTEATYISRTGSRIRALIEAAIDSAVRRGKVRRKGDFLWHPGMQEAPLRDRSELPDGSKKLKVVAPEEIEVAIRKGVADASDMDRQEIPAAVVRLLLGFKRTTETTQARVIRVLDGMIAGGGLVQEGRHVSLKE